MSYTSFQTINNLEEMSFIAGTKMTLEFDFYDEAGSPIDISDFDCYWQLAPYGRPGDRILNITGTITATNKFTVEFDDETSSLSGKYIHQPVLIDILNVEQRPVQGIITIIPKIKTSQEEL